MRVARQRLRGEAWYVYRDEASGRQLRLNGLAHRFTAGLDGRLTVGQLWDRLLEQVADEAPSQHEIVALVQQLADGSLVSIDHGAELSRLARRETERRRRRLLSSVNPLAFKVRLFDPGPLLERTWRIAAPLYSGWALLAYLAILLGAAGLALEHAEALGAYASAHVPTPGFALALLLVYPPLKAVHEMAHAWAVRVWGGRVPEIGVTLLFGMPVPYVDASAAALFASRAQRVAVGLAGILAELLMAALALWVWLSIEDGGLRTAAFAVMTIGAVSTLFVNGNPLMRFDAYFALSDAIGVPNLAERSRQAWVALARRAVAGEHAAPLPPGPRRDLPGLLAYGLASWAYRLAVMLWLVTLIVPYSRTVAAALAAWAAWHAFGRAAWQVLRWLWRVRWQSAAPGRAIAGTAIAATGVALLLGAVPMPDATTLPGVVMPADAARVRAAEPGRVVEVRVTPGQPVRAGEPLLRMDSDALQAERERLLAALDGQRTEQIRNLVSADRSASGVAQDEIDRTRARLSDVEARLERLLLRAPADGVVAFLDADGPLERQVRQGEALLYVLQPDSMRIHALARDDQARRLSAGAAGAQARLGDAPGRSVTLQLAGQVPQAVWVLPGAALAEHAGGPIATDPADRDGLRTLEPWFQLEFVPAATLPRVGASAEVRILHAPRPALEQMADAVRRLFLRRFEG